MGFPSKSASQTRRLTMPPHCTKRTTNSARRFLAHRTSSPPPSRDMNEEDVDRLPSEKVRDYLKRLIKKLDSLDDRDWFGEDGWRRYLDMEE